MMTQQFNHRLLRDHAFGIVAATAIANLPPGIAITPLVPPELAGSVHLMPGLIDVRALTQDRANALLGSLHQAHLSGEQPSVQLLLATEADLDEVARHWNARQLVSPQSGTKSWLRLHDPRVLHQLLRILAPAQRNTLLGPVKAITYWVAGTWMQASALQVSTSQVQSDSLPTSQAAARWDWDRVSNIGIINRALQAAGVDGAQLHLQGAVVEQLIGRARQHYALTEMRDLVEFATRGLTAGMTFDTHLRVAAALRPQGPDDDSDLADRLALLDDDVWQEQRLQTLANTPPIT
jgi:hypothetical protein